MKTMVYILLPVHNRKTITQKFVDELNNQTFQRFHLVLIDDGSTDGTGEMVSTLIPSEKLTIITGNGDWWWAGSIQQGLDYVRELSPEEDDIVLMINDDVSFEPHFIFEGVRYLDKRPNSMLLAQFYSTESGQVLETGIHADLSKMQFRTAESKQSINCLSTRGLFSTWKVICRTGRFHPRLLPHYYSDYEYTIRAGRKGALLETSSKVFLSPSLNETGFHPDEGRKWSLCELFSKKSAMNPLYGSSFVILACKFWQVPYGLLKVWGVAIKHWNMGLK